MSTDIQPTSEMTAEETFESLTGFDELAISKHYGREVTDLADKSPTTFLRALVFVAKRREGASDTEAKDASMRLPLSEVNGYFQPDDEDVMPDEPESESGEGGSRLGE